MLSAEDPPFHSKQDVLTIPVAPQATTTLPQYSLPYPLWILFSFNGAIFILPNIALMSIVNDRASIPPEYLPAYSAISFLPWSVKPLYAYLSTVLVHRFKLVQRHALIAILLCMSGLSFVGTAFVPLDGVILCFAWGFVRGLASSWPEFLLGLTLIDTARGLSLCTNENIGREEEEEKMSEDVSLASTLPRDHSNNRNNTSMTATALYEEIVSVFQAQAATSRNIGSLIAGGFTFIVFAWRHYRRVMNDDKDTDQVELSDAVVTMLLLLTAALPFIGSMIAIKYKVGTMTSSSVQGIEHIIQGDEGRGSLQRRRKGRYDEVAASEDEPEGDATAASNALEKNAIAPLSFDIDESQMQSENSERKCYAAVLVLFQLLLIFSALKGPISSATTHVAWLSAVIAVSVCLAGTITAASYYQRKNISRREGQMSDEKQIPAKRLALYLLLRHSLPGSGYIFYSYLFSLFERNPLFMQCLSILGSAGATCASWFYGRFVAKQFNSGRGIIGVIVATTIISSLSSLFNIIIFRADDNGNGQEGGLDLRILVAPIYFLTGVVAELNFMPSLVLATTNVVATDDEPAAQTDTGNIPFGEADDASPLLYDEGMQYASYVSCIDFGEQLGSWITVPIVASLGISRDNGWENLDRLILLCASVYMVSLVYLCLIRPPRKRSVVKMSTPNNGELA